MLAAGIDPGEVRDELETHLREKVADLVRAGLDEEAAFHSAAEALGTGPALQQEFDTAMPWHRRLQRFLCQPVGVFPADLGFVAKSSIAYATLVIGFGLWNTLKAIHVIHDLGLPDREISLLWFALGLALVVCSYVLWSAISYLHHRSFSTAGVLAGAWIFFAWFLLNGFTGDYLKLVFDVPALSGSSNRAYGVFFVIWTIGLNRVHAAWRKNLREAEDRSKGMPPILD